MYSVQKLSLIVLLLCSISCKKNTSESLTKPGKSHLIIEGSTNPNNPGVVTNAEAAAKIAEEAGYNTQFVYIKNTKGLTSINLSMLTSLEEVIVQNNIDLNDLNLDHLQTAATLTIERNPNLRIISLPQFTKAVKTNIFSTTAIFKVLMPKLVFVRDELNFTQCYDIQIPLLDSTGNMRFQYCGNPDKSISLSLPSLKKTGDFKYYSNFFPTSSIPKLYSVSTLDISFSPQSTTISLPLLKMVNGLNISGDYGTDPRIITTPALESVAGNIQINNLAGDQPLTFPELKTVGENIIITNNAGLTGFIVPKLKSIRGYLKISGSNTALSILNLPLLDTVYEELDIKSVPKLSILTLPALKFTDSFTVGNCQMLSAVSLPELANANSFSLSSSPLTSISVPKLISVNSNFSIGSCSGLNSLSLPELKFVGHSFSIANNPLLASITFNSSIIFSSTGNGTSGTPPPGMPNSIPGCYTVGAPIILSGNILSTSQINNFLSLLVNQPIILQCRRITLNQASFSPPTGQGLTDKATLQSRNNVVTTN